MRSSSGIASRGTRAAMTDAEADRSTPLARVRGTAIEHLIPRIVEVLQTMPIAELYVLLNARSAAPPSPALADLSAREREVFDFAVRGASNASIASTLGITLKTVQTHRARINKKLGVHNPGELISLAYQASVL
jgi:DNA-binding CsgD family transcriptional regulator